MFDKFNFNIMRIFIRSLLALTVCLYSQTLNAAFVVHSITGNVTVIKGGTSRPLKKGEKVAPGDNVNIPADGTLEIINDVNNTIYTSTSSGTYSVSRMLLDAKSKAADNSTALKDRLRFGSKSDSGSSDKSKVYVETGMVKRSMATFDPSASGLTIDPKSLAHHITDIVKGGNRLTSKIPVSLKHNNDTTGMAFTLSNTFDFPIYFNVIKISGTDMDKKADISNIGQPIGTYVLQPEQSITRTSPQIINNDERHIIVITHCQYDIDMLLEQVNLQLSSHSTDEPEIDIPVYVTEL